MERFRNFDIWPYLGRHSLLGAKVTCYKFVALGKASNPQVKIWEGPLGTFREGLEKMPPIMTTLITKLHASKAMIPLSTIYLAIYTVRALLAVRPIKVALGG